MTDVNNKLNYNNENIILWIIEDNEFFRHTVKDMLNGTGRFKYILGFTNCEEALQALSEGMAPDIILLDISLPGMTGIEGINNFKSLSPNTFIIMLTVHDDNENVFNSMVAGASGYILKTSPKEKIIESIDEVLHGGVPMTSKIARKVLDIFTSFHKPSSEYKLTKREKEVLRFLVEGKTKKQIADAIYLSYHTIDNHIRNIYKKLHVHTRTAAVTKTLREKL